MDVLPLFKSHYSIGRSILTLEKSGTSEEDAPDSIIDIAKEAGLKEVYLIEDGFGGFLQAFTNLKAAGIKLIFGIRLWVVPDITDKSEASLKKQSRVVIIARNYAGYKRLIKIYSKAYQQGFYYEPRIDYASLKDAWDENDLRLTIPFYDSFVFCNSLILNASCIPDFSFAKPDFFVENSDLPFDDIIEQNVRRFAGDTYRVIPARSIYYKARKDFKAYLTFRCINNRTTLEKPNFEHMGSQEFCYEAWKEMNAK